ncbi:MAG TPA: NAD(P)H-hydrate epimerase, partial [Candidatus Limnocylindrales bacterium]
MGTTPRHSPLRDAASSEDPAADGRPDPSTPAPLPGDDPELFSLDLAGLARRWAAAMARPPMSAEAMTGADRRAQAFGVPGMRLMEQAGTAVAAAVRALAVEQGRLDSGPIVVLAGPGNNGGDGFVAARRLAAAGATVIVALVASEGRPTGPDAGRNWDRLDRVARVQRLHTPVARDVATFGQGIERAAVIVDALLGTGVRGVLRDPIRAAVEVANRARSARVPIVAVDTPTAVDLTSGEPSDPVVRADLTVTFHRPKLGLLSAHGRALAGRVLVAPIGIPPEADRA